MPPSKARAQGSRKEPNKNGLVAPPWRAESMTTRVVLSPCATANGPTAEVAARARPAWLAFFKNCLLDTPAVMNCLSSLRSSFLSRDATNEIFGRKGILRHCRVPGKRFLASVHGRRKYSGDRRTTTRDYF